MRWQSGADSDKLDDYYYIELSAVTLKLNSNSAPANSSTLYLLPTFVLFYCSHLQGYWVRLIKLKLRSYHSIDDVQIFLVFTTI